MEVAEYNNLFRELFPAEWRLFRQSLSDRGTTLTLCQVFAATDEEFARVSPEHPSVEQFIELMERDYFPIPEVWMETEEGELSEWLFHEIPVSPFYEACEFDEDPHGLWPVFQVLKTLNGDTLHHLEAEKERGKRCPLRALFVLACNELHRVDLRRLEALSRREPGPLRFLTLALRIMSKETGNIWFDMDYEMYGGETGIAWTPRNVRAIKREYKAALKGIDGLRELNEWFTKDPRRIRAASELWRKAAIL